MKFVRDSLVSFTLSHIYVYPWGVILIRICSYMYPHGYTYVYMHIRTTSRITPAHGYYFECNSRMEITPTRYSTRCQLITAVPNPLYRTRGQHANQNYFALFESDLLRYGKFENIFNFCPHDSTIFDGCCSHKIRNQIHSATLASCIRAL